MNLAFVIMGAAVLGGAAMLCTVRAFRAALSLTTPTALALAAAGGPTAEYAEQVLTAGVLAGRISAHQYRQGVEALVCLAPRVDAGRLLG